MKSKNIILNEIELAEAYFDEACEKMDNREYYEAAELAQNVLQILEDTTEYKTYAQALTLLGVIYSTLGNEGMSEDFYLKGLKWAEDGHHDEYCHFFYTNLGCSYQLLNDNQKALEYFLLAQEYLLNRTQSDTPAYRIWCLITILNLIISYVELQQYKQAEQYLQEFEEEVRKETIPEDVQYSYLLSKCLLYLKTGRTTFVENQCDALMDGIKSFSASDFYENVNRLCDIFHSVGRNDLWEKTLSYFEEFMSNQESVYFKLILAEKWIAFYKETGEMKKYTDACVCHTNLYLEQQDIWKKEKANVLNTKIALYKKESEYKQVQNQRNTDYLTKIGNRYLLKEEFSDVCQKAAEKNCYLCMGIIDIDYFKNLNDTFGHLQGDQCLKSISGSIMRAIEGYGNVYRYGGDEFILLLIVDEVTRLDEIAEDIKDKIQIDLSEYPSKVSVSQGYTYTDSNTQPDMLELLTSADNELYYIKANGRNSYRVSKFSIESGITNRERE